MVLFLRFNCQNDCLQYCLKKPTFNLLLERASEEDGHSPDPLLLRQKTVAVFVECSEHWRQEHKEVRRQQGEREKERGVREREKKE